MGGKPRQAVLLPSGTQLSKNHQRTLVSVITNFKRAMRHRKWATKDGASLQCGVASNAFLAAAKRHRLSCDLVLWEAGTRHGYLHSLQGVHHVATRVGDVFIDWTARQYSEHAAYPMLWLDEQSVFNSASVI